MCRNIKTLFNFDPPATGEEIHNASLQFVRKLSGFTKPSQVKETENYQESQMEFLTVGQKNKPFNKFNLPKVAVVVPILGLMFTFITFSAGQFVDQEKSIGNFFSAAASFSSPAPLVSPLSSEKRDTKKFRQNQASNEGVLRDQNSQEEPD